MNNNRKDVYVTIPLDRETAERLQHIADAETEGNRSQYIRKLIREALGIVDNGERQEQAA